MRYGCNTEYIAERLKSIFHFLFVHAEMSPNVEQALVPQVGDFAQACGWIVEFHLEAYVNH